MLSESANRCALCVYSGGCANKSETSVQTLRNDELTQPCSFPSEPLRLGCKLHTAALPMPQPPTPAVHQLRGNRTWQCPTSTAPRPACLASGRAHPAYALRCLNAAPPCGPKEGPDRASLQHQSMQAAATQPHGRHRGPSQRIPDPGQPTETRRTSWPRPHRDWQAGPGALQARPPRRSRRLAVQSTSQPTALPRALRGRRSVRRDPAPRSFPPSATRESGGREPATRGSRWVLRSDGSLGGDEGWRGVGGRRGVRRGVRGWRLTRRPSIGG